MLGKTRAVGPPLCETASHGLVGLGLCLEDEDPCPWLLLLDFPNPLLLYCWRPYYLRSDH